MPSEDGYSEISKDVSTLAFHIMFQAITDAFGLGKLHLGSSISDYEKNTRASLVITESRAFIESEEFETVCELARIHYDAPTHQKVRDYLKRVKDGSVAYNKKDLIREYQGWGKRNVGVDKQDSSPQAAQEKH